jgi:hypothetical protein
LFGLFYIPNKKATMSVAFLLIGSGSVDVSAVAAT